jgi:riboflavin synthase
MFTGIVQGIGRVRALTPRGGDCEIDIASGGLDLAGMKPGDSMAVAGVCLTLTRLEAQAFSADVCAETLSCTVLGALAPGNAVNLEPALRAGDALGGHLVSGHVDGVGRLLARHAEGRSHRLRFEAPADLARFIARKGSICIDGVSLTVNDTDGACFGVNLVPHTLQATTLQDLQPGARVNLEVDLLARYVARSLEFLSQPS